ADDVIDNARAARAAGKTTGSRTQSPLISGVGDVSIGISPLGSCADSRKATPFSIARRMDDVSLIGNAPAARTESAAAASARLRWFPGSCRVCCCWWPSASGFSSCGARLHLVGTLAHKDHGSEFFARAILRQALFWISRAHLQILRSLQIDDGYRIFIQDKTFHFPQAVAATQNGFAYPTKHVPARRVQRFFDGPFHSVSKGI